MENTATSATTAATASTSAGSAQTITLKHPIKSASGQQITALTIRRPTRKDLKQAQKSGKDEIEIEDLLFSRLTGLLIEDLDMLDIEDNRQLQDCFRKMRGGDD